jgi:hypothetical protein
MEALNHKSNLSEKIPIEIGTAVQIEIEGIDHRFHSVFVGSIPNDFMIFRTPASGHIFSIRTNIFAGQKMVIRFLAGGTVYGFQANLIEAVTSPERLMFVTFPDEMASHNLRLRRRIECFLPANVTINQTEYDGIVIDLNDIGCRFSTSLAGKETLAGDIVGDVTISLLLPGSEKELKLAGTPRNIDRNGKTINIGIKFLDADDETKNRIRDYVGSLEKALHGEEAAAAEPKSD